VARVRGLLMIAMLGCLSDWAVKAAQPVLWDGWVPHETERSLANLLWATPLVVAVVWMLPTRLSVIGCGLMFGGMIANLLDIAADGVAWNMLPLPGSDLWFNTADLWIVLGAALLIWSVAGECWKLRPARWATR